MQTTTPPESAPAKRVGVRQRSRQANQDKIIMAARELFAELGYEAATLRQIAAAARLGLGTLFNYISDKRDLIYLIFNQEMDQLTDAGLAAPRPWQSFTAKILSIVEPQYRMFGSEPTLSRILLSEVLLQTPGMHLERWRANRWRLINSIKDLVAAAQATGELGSREAGAGGAAGRRAAAGGESGADRPQHLFPLLGRAALVAGVAAAGVARGAQGVRAAVEAADGGPEPRVRRIVTVPLSGSRFNRGKREATSHLVDDQACSSRPSSSKLSFWRSQNLCILL